MYEQSYSGTVTIGGVEVSQADFAIADGSGVVFIPRRFIEQVLNKAEAIAGKEAAMTRALADGQAVSQVLGASYEHMLKS